jgi:hypothetical protein
MISIRVIYQAIHSVPSGGTFSTDYVNQTIFRVTWPAIRSTSIVLMSASECSREDKRAFTPAFDRFVGDAPITVQNIASQEGFVDFRINVEWEQPIDVAVDIVVLDPPTLMVVVDPDLQDQEVFQVDTRPTTQHIGRSRKIKEPQRPLTKKSKARESSKARRT